MAMKNGSFRHFSHGMTKIDEKTEFLGKALSVLVGENYPLLIKLIKRMKGFLCKCILMIENLQGKNSW